MTHEPAPDRARVLFEEQRDRNYRRTDRVFAALLLGQWAFAIAVALVWSPYAWEGQVRSVHVHVIAALVLGGLLSGFPIFLIRVRPGAAVTRHVVSCAQMLWSALLIHLSGGRIETHFHVFGSLAFVAFYRDWKVLAPATLVVALDHLVRGLAWPESVYGIRDPEWWRFLEHASWVGFEDVVLVIACLRGVEEMKEIAAKRAEIERLSESEILKKSQALAVALEELRSSQETLVRAEKLAAVGQLAASVAHEVRNPLAAIKGAASYVAKRLAADPAKALADPRVKQFLEIIEREVNAVTKIVGDLLDFARERNPVLAPCPVRSVVADALSVVAVPPGRRVELVNDVSDSFPPPRADRDLLRQAVLNLVQNAVEAFPEGRPGRVAVTADASNGSWRLRVQDDGNGVPADVQPKLFQPLFTTKTKGTGLGLAIVQSIARRHAGKARLESEAGRGTTVVLELPTEPPAEASAPVTTEAGEAWVSP
jgi:signal transduction histidine kinase